MPEILNGEQWGMAHADCIEHMATMPAASVDFSIFSPPFPAVYAYTSSPADIGNSEDLRGEAKLHFSFFFRQLARVMKPGRVICLHCTDIVRMKRSGGQGLYPFHDLLIRIGERSGLIFDYCWAIRKNPQSQAIRTKSHQLQFAGLERDRSQSRGALPDYVIKFLAPGENGKPIIAPEQVSRNDWIGMAEHCWPDIKETATLNVEGSKGPDDTKHICPLQLPLIERFIKLFSDPDELVFSPFAGIGSEGYAALKLGRRFYGCELKEEYFLKAQENLGRACRLREQDQRTMFDALEVATA